jgi:Ca2+-binding RTX toxin-like protein
VVRDKAYQDGFLIEDTKDYYAQDSLGNVWYFGERTREYEPGNPDPISTAGSWIAGKDGAEAGIVMEAAPQVGDKYAQEHAPGVAEDYARVQSLDAWADVGYGSFTGVLETKDVNPLDPSVELKYYAAGVGNILTTTADGEFDQLTAVVMRGTAGADSLLGYFGGDEMRGNGGNDALDGDRGADTINGGAGDDALTGGTGADTFVFDLSGGVSTEVDSIADYSLAEHDMLRLPNGAADIVSDVKLSQHGGWELTLSDGHVIALPRLRDLNHDGHIVDQLFFG